MNRQSLIAPFFVFEGNDLVIYQTIDEIEKKIEPIDVLNHEYDIYDAMGNILQFHIIQKECCFLGLFDMIIDTVQFSHGLTASQNELLNRMQKTYVALGGCETDNLGFDELKKKLFDLLQFQVNY